MSKSNSKGAVFGRYLFLVLVGIFTLLPLVWLFFATFKTNAEIFGSNSLFPSSFSFDSYIKGWQGSGQFTYGRFFLNSFLLTVPTVFFTILSSILVGYGFARFNFFGKKVLKVILISTLMLPNAILIVPRYILFTELGWNNTYLTFYIPAALGCYPFFTYQMLQYFRGLPRELDEAARIDGCTSFGLLTRILLPLCKPAICSVGLLQFIWIWNDYFNVNIYINSVSKYPLALGLRMSLDSQAAVDWSPIFAMSLAAIVPCVILFFSGQRYFVEGIASTGIKD